MDFNYIKTQAEKYKDQLEKIKVVLLDVDGILTDAKVYYSGEELGFNRFFDVNDGYGMKILQLFSDIEVGIITGGDSLGVLERFRVLGVKHFYYGSEDKRGAYLEIKEKMKLKDENILYMGDEFFDMPLLKKAGFSATTQKASWEVKECVDFITYAPAGHGAVREVIDMVRYVQKIKPDIPDFD